MIRQQPTGSAGGSARPTAAALEHSHERRFAAALETCLLSLSFAFIIGTAAAQSASGPIVNGRQWQPSAQQIDTKEGDTWRQWNYRVQPKVDRLYDDIMRAATSPGR